MHKCTVHPLLPVLMAGLVVGGLSLKLTTARAQSSNPTAPRNVVIPIRPLASLSTVPVPAVPGIQQYVSNQSAAVALGKSLFWDMQTGSDGVQACASCHFNAGADSRNKNQINPGTPGGDPTFQLLQVKAGKEDAVVEHFRTLEPESRKESGCLMYVVHRGTSNSREFLVYEQYEDEAALEAHRQTPHFLEHAPKIYEYCESQQRALYRPLSENKRELIAD